MPLYDCGSVEIVLPYETESVEIVDWYQNDPYDGSEILVKYEINGDFGRRDGAVFDVDIRITDRDNPAVRGSVSKQVTAYADRFLDNAWVQMESRPTANTGLIDGTLPAKAEVEASGGGFTFTDSTDIEFVPEALERLEITNAEQDGSKVVVDFEVGGGGGFNIGEDDAGNIGEVMVKNPVPWADGTESWIPGLDASSAANLLPDPTNIQLGAFDGEVTLDGDTTTATIEIPLGVTPPESFGSVESFVGVGVTTESGTQLIDTYDISIDPVAWIDDVDVDCSLTESEIEVGETASLDATFTNNAGPGAFGGTIEFDMLVEVFADNEKVASNEYLNFRGPRGVGSDQDGDQVSETFEVSPPFPDKYRIELSYNTVEGTASRIIPTDEIL